MPKSKNPTEKKKPIKKILIIVGSILAFFILIGIIFSGSENSNDNDLDTSQLMQNIREAAVKVEYSALDVLIANLEIYRITYGSYPNTIDSLLEEHNLKGNLKNHEFKNEGRFWSLFFDSADGNTKLFSSDTKNVHYTDENGDVRTIRYSFDDDGKMTITQVK